MESEREWVTRDTWLAIAAAVGGCAVIVAAAAFVLRNGMAPVQYEAATTIPASPAPLTPSGENAAAADAETDPDMAAVKKAYVLPPDKVLARIEAPPEARATLYQQINPQQARRMPRTPTGMILRVDGDDFKPLSMTWGTGFSVGSVAQVLLQESRPNVEVKGSFPQLSGDLLFRPGAKPEDYMHGLEQLIRDDLKTPCKIEYVEVQRPMTVLKGTWHFKPAPNANDTAADLPTVEVYGVKLDKNLGNGGNAEGTPAEMAESLGGWLGKPLVIEAAGIPPRIHLHFNYDEMQDPDARDKARAPENVLKHIEEQTGLKASEETRGVRRLLIERE